MSIAGMKGEDMLFPENGYELGQSIAIDPKSENFLLESEVGGQSSVNLPKGSYDEEVGSGIDVEGNAIEKSKYLLTEEAPMDREITTSKKCCGKWDFIEEKDFEDITCSRERK
jgi:hypothetical protein